MSNTPYRGCIYARGRLKACGMQLPEDLYRGLPTAQQSIIRFQMVDSIITNSIPKRKNVVAETTKAKL